MESASAVLALAGEVARWPLTTLREKLVKIGARIGPRTGVQRLFAPETGRRTRPPVDRGSAEEQGVGCRRARPGDIGRPADDTGRGASRAEAGCRGSSRTTP